MSLNVADPLLSGDYGSAVFDAMSVESVESAQVGGRETPLNQCALTSVPFSSGSPLPRR